MKRDRGEALRLLVRSAELGKVQAQVQYAALLGDGRGGVRRDEAAAVAWLGRAAEAGYAEAQFRLAALVRAGRGCPADAARAAALVDAAAGKGCQLETAPLSVVSPSSRLILRRAIVSRHGLEAWTFFLKERARARGTPTLKRR